jgi:hypothetical protein
VHLRGEELKFHARLLGGHGPIQCTARSFKTGVELALTDVGIEIEVRRTQLAVELIEIRAQLLGGVQPLGFGRLVRAVARRAIYKSRIGLRMARRYYVGAYRSSNARMESS